MKYKKCHRDREGQPKDNLWDAVEANRKAFSSKKCFAHGVGLGDCDGGIIKAHTVSRGPNLSKIAEDGHVLQFSANVNDLIKSGGRLVVKKLGIRDASIFNGFCRKHDRELFSCIENEAFVGRADQCLAVAFRTLSREVYGKDASAHMRETLRGADKGRSQLEQLMIQSMLDDIDTGNEAARREQKVTLDALTDAMAKGTPEELASVVFEFAEPLPFMFAGAWSPFVDLYNAELQKGLLDELLEQCIVSSFATENGSMICVSWRKTTHAPGSIIAKQLMKLPEELVASASLQFVMKHIENLFFNPAWFGALPAEQENHLKKLAADGLDFMGSVPSVPLRLDIDFALPRVSRTFRV